jgi:hypothetical protein
MYCSRGSGRRRVRGEGRRERGRGGRRLLNWRRGMQGRIGGRGHSATCGRENEEERGVLRRGRGSSSGRRCCGATVEGDGARLTRRELLTGGAERKQGRAAVAGCGRVRQRGKKNEVGSARMNSDYFYFCQIYFKLVRFVLTKRWTYQAPKILNKIWLERA